MKGMSLSAISSFLKCACNLNVAVLGYQIDSRLIKKGDLFFAIRGAKFDGHDFLCDIAKQGAIGAVVNKSYKGPNFGLELLLVDSVDDSLRLLAKHSLSLTDQKVIGITGSCGKTTTKDFLASILSVKYRVEQTRGSENSKLSLPLTVLNRKIDIDILILEMGMGEPGDIARLVDIAPPDIAVLTNVSLAHAAFFPGGLEQIAKSKAEIFSHEKTKIGFCCWQAFQYLHSLKFKCPIKTFAINHVEADFCKIPFSTPFVEAHILHNLMASFVVAKQLQVEDEIFEKQMQFLKLPNMRYERIEKKGLHFINDAYNANPGSMKAALQSFHCNKISGKKIAVLGSMKELGDFCYSSHKELGLIASNFVDILLTLGEETKPMIEEFKKHKSAGFYFSDKQLLLKKLQQLTEPGDEILLKGSRAMKLETILEEF